MRVLITLQLDQKNMLSYFWICGNLIEMIYQKLVLILIFLIGNDIDHLSYTPFINHLSYTPFMNDLFLPFIHFPHWIN